MTSSPKQDLPPSDLRPIYISPRDDDEKPFEMAFPPLIPGGRELAPTGSTGSTLKKSLVQEILCWLDKSEGNFVKWNGDLRRICLDHEMIEVVKERSLASIESEQGPLSVGQVLERDSDELLGRYLTSIGRTSFGSLPKDLRTNLTSLAQSDPNLLMQEFEEVMAPLNYPDTAGVSLALVQLAGIAKALGLGADFDSKILPSPGKLPDWFRASSGFKAEGNLAADSLWLLSAALYGAGFVSSCSAILPKFLLPHTLINLSHQPDMILYGAAAMLSGVLGLIGSEELRKIVKKKPPSLEPPLGLAMTAARKVLAA